MIGETGAIDGNNSMIGTSAPDFVELLVEVGSRLWVDDETSFIVAGQKNVMEIVCGNIATIVTGDGNDFDVLCRITVIILNEVRMLLDNVVLFVGEIDNLDYHRQEKEIDDIKVCQYQEAYNLLQFDNWKNALKKANDFLKTII